MNQDEGEADGKAGEVSGTNLGVGGAQHDQHEDEGGDNFHEEGAAHTAGIGNTVGAECTGEVGGGHDIGDQHEAGTGDDTADNLAYPGATGVFPAHAAAQGYGQGDGGVDVATADATNGIGHGNN